MNATLGLPQPLYRRTAWACFILALSALIAGAVGCGAAHADTLRLTVGTERVIDLAAPISRIVIGTAGIVDASVQDEHRVQLVALRAGRTTLAVFTASGGEATVATLVVEDPAAMPAAMAAPAAAAPGAGLAQAMASQPGLGGVQVHSIGDHVILSGTLPDLQTHEEAAALARAFGGPAVVDQTQVGGDQMVAVEIRFAAIAANTVNELGFNFQALGSDFQGFSASPNSLASSASGAAFTSGLPIASAFNLLLSGSTSKGSVLGIISALSSAGLTQLLAQPTLVVRSGEHASFLAGGEVPIPVPQGSGNSNTITIEYHPYGVKLDVSPTVLSNNRISLQVSPEVSEIDNANALTINGFSVPAFRKRSTSTTVELGDGESFVIAGLIYNNNAITESRLPFLGSIPILGAFFKISANSRERQELVVIATPHLVHPLNSRSLPPLPGEEIAHYNPGVGSMLLNTTSLNKALASYGLLP